MRQLYIRAYQCSRTEDLCEDDKAIQGLYVVEVGPDLSDAKAASVALDRFHLKIGIECLDDFEFIATDIDRILAEDPNHEAYSGELLGGDVWKVSDNPDWIGDLGSL